MCSTSRATLKRTLNDLGHLCDWVGGLSSTTRSNRPQALTAILPEATAPQCDGLKVDLQILSNFLVLLSIRHRQDDPTALRYLLWSPMGVNPMFQFQTVRRFQANSFSNARHLGIIYFNINNSSHL